MASLQGPPYLLAVGAPILVKVVAFNSIGDGPASSVGGTAVSATVPASPTNLLNVLS